MPRDDSGPGGDICDWLEMDEQFRQMIGTLCGARQSTVEELKPLNEALFPDDKSLRQQLRKTKQFESFADALVVMMAKDGAADSLMAEAQQLLFFFQATEARIGTMLTACRRRG
jgi:hypothetical protein